MHYLTKDDVLDLHTYAVLRYGGRLGIASHDRLMSVVTAPRQVLFESELYPDLPSKAAALMFLMIKSRPFVSANEATALLCMLRFLTLNNASLHHDVAERNCSGWCDPFPIPILIAAELSTGCVSAWHNRHSLAE